MTLKENQNIRSLTLVYFGTWFILYYTARMVKGREWLLTRMTKD